MSEKPRKKAGLIFLFVLIAIASIAATAAGLFYTTLQQLLGMSFKWGSVVLFVSVAIFIGALASVNRISYNTKTQRDKRVETIRKPTRKTIIWIAIAIVSGAGTIIPLVLWSMMMIRRYDWLLIAMISVSPGLFLFSDFILISGRTQRIKVISEMDEDIT